MKYSILNFQLSIVMSALISFAGCNRNNDEQQDVYSDWRDVKVDSLEQVLATKKLTDTELLRIHRDLSFGYMQINFKKSVYHAKQGIIYADKLNKPLTKGYLYNRLGVSYYGISKDDSAMFYFNKALEQVNLIYKNNAYDIYDIDNLKSQVYGAIGNLYNAQDNNHEALKYYLMMLELLEKNHWKHQTIILYNNIGEIYINLDNYEEAQMYFIKMKALSAEVNDEFWNAMCYFQTARVDFYFHKNYPKALENAKTACEMMDANPNVNNVEKIGLLLLLSEIYLDGYQDYSNAVKQATLALQYAKENDEPANISDALARLADIYLHKGMYNESERTALQALAIDSARKDDNILLLNILAKSSAFLGKPKQTVDYFNRSSVLTSKLSNKNYMLALTEMQIKYETEKKELEIENQKNIIKRQNLQRGLLAGGVAVSIVILALLWYLLRLRNRRNAALAEMNATKDKFFSIISHDLKNPAIAQREALQTLIQNARSWKMDTLTDYYHELLKSADGQVELLYNLLNWAQVQTGRMTYTPTMFNLFSQLSSDISMIRKMAENKGITFVADISEDANVFGDSNMLTTVVRNLLTNAVKFTSKGGTVTCRVAARHDPTAQYNISVSDTGIGMSEEQIKNLFKLDSRLSSSGTADEQGSGLGLIVCKELLEKHGSQLHIESTEGKGSRFEFTISA